MTSATTGISNFEEGNERAFYHQVLLLKGSPWQLTAAATGRAGGTSSVWTVEHRDTGQQGAIKFLRNPDSRVRKRFEREYELARGGGIPWTPRAIECDFGVFPWIVFEWVDGVTLAEHIAKSGPLTGLALDTFLRQLWEARTQFAAAGLANRDLSGGNVMLRRSDGRVVVIDWGIGFKEGGTRTQYGLNMWTPGFGSPEQVIGDTVDFAADIWGWGSVGYYATTGKHVYPAEEIEYKRAISVRTPIDWAEVPQHWKDPLAAALTYERTPLNGETAEEMATRMAATINGLLPLLPEERKLAEVLTRLGALEQELARRPARRPSRRHRTGGAVASIIDAAVEEAQSVRQPGPQLRPSRRHHRRSVGAVAVGVVSLVAAVWVSSGRPFLQERSEGEPTTTMSVPPTTRIGLSPFDDYQDVQYFRSQHADTGYHQPLAAHAIIAHGDMRPSSSLLCEIRVFRPGETVRDLGGGDLILSRVLASPDQINQGIQRATAEEQARHGKCPVTQR